MVMAQEDFTVEGRRVVVLGAARSGIAAAELLARRGARVVVSEAGDTFDGADRLRAAGIGSSSADIPPQPSRMRIWSSPVPAYRSRESCSLPSAPRHRAHRRTGAGLAVAEGSRHCHHRHQGQVHHHDARRPHAHRRRGEGARRRQHRRAGECPGRRVDTPDDARGRDEQLPARDHHDVQALDCRVAQLRRGPSRPPPDGGDLCRRQGAHLRQPAIRGLGGTQRR
jgi:glycine/D-amino acid oxidase-like deaminating enzyme